MKPVLPIVLASIMTFFLSFVTGFLTNGVDVHFFIFTYLIYILGGLFTTLVSTEHKIRYGTYYGLVNAIILGIFLKIPHEAPLIIILGTFGGFIGAMTNENYKSSFFNKYNFRPLIAVIMGVLVTFLCYILLIFIAALDDGIASANLSGTVYIWSNFCNNGVIYLNFHEQV